MKKFSPILNGFKGSNVQEVQKGILNPSKLDNTKYAIFSNGQIQEYLKSVITKNEGMALEIQKSVVANVKEELSHLIPVNIMHNGKAKKFYVTKADSCIELVKAMEPVNRKEGYFNSKINEDDILNFINKNEKVDDDMLIKEFGEDVTEILNTLEEDGKLDVDEDGFYFVNKIDEGSENEEAEEEDEEVSTGEDKKEDEGAVEDEEVTQEEDNEGEAGEEGQGQESAGTVGAAGCGTQEINLDNEDEGAAEDENEGEESVSTEEQNDLSESEDAQEDIEEDKGAQGAAGEDEGVGEDVDTEGAGTEGAGTEGVGTEGVGTEGAEDTGTEMTPEELEAYAKKTATVTLQKFYNNSTDERLKEIAAMELKSRGINVENGDTVANANNQNGELPENKAALDALEKFTKDYLGKYDNEDLISVVVELANQDPGKRKELKDLYRTFYSMNNNGNKLLKVDEEEFKTFLTDHYFNNFTPGDLQSYAYLLISKNPKEYRKYKKMMDLENEPIV